MIGLRRIFTIAHKETIHILRDPRSLMFMLILPVFQVILLGYALTFDITHIPLAIRDMDKTAASRLLTQRFTTGEHFSLVARPESDAEVKDLLDSGLGKVVLVIPPGFSRKLSGSGVTGVQVLTDGSDPNVARLGYNYANAIASAFSRDAMLTSIEKKGIEADLSPVLSQKRRVWYNPELRSQNFIIPGLIAVILASVAGIQSCVAIVREKEQGTVENLMVSRLKPYELIIGKVAPYLFIGVLESAAVVALAIFWFNVPFRGSIALYSLNLGVFLIATMGLGLLVSSVTDSEQVAALGAMMATLLPSFLLSGYVFPIASMPKVLQYITMLFPARYFIQISRNIFLKASGFSVILPDFLALVIFSTVVLSAASFFTSRRLH